MRLSDAKNHTNIFVFLSKLMLYEDNSILCFTNFKKL